MCITENAIVKMYRNHLSVIIFQILKHNDASKISTYLIFYFLIHRGQIIRENKNASLHSP